MALTNIITTTSNRKSDPDPLSLSALALFHPSSSIAFPLSLSLRLTHEHTETMRKTKRTLKGLSRGQAWGKGSAPWCAKYTHARVSPLRGFAWHRAQAAYSCYDTRTETRVCTRVGGLTPSLLCIYWLSSRSLGRKCITPGIIRLVIGIARRRKRAKR